MSPVGTPEHPYVENPKHVPNPLDMTGNVETSGTSGSSLQHDIEAVSPVFANERERRAGLTPLEPQETPTVPSTGVGDSTVGQTLDTTGTDGRDGIPEVPRVEGTIPDASTGPEGPSPAATIPIIDTTGLGAPPIGEVMAEVVALVEPTSEQAAEVDTKVEAVETEKAVKVDETKVEKFDPGEHTVHDVLAYLETANATEQKRVLAAEGGSNGKQRKTLVGG